MKKLRIIAAIGLVAALVFSLAACQPASPAQTADTESETLDVVYVSDGSELEDGVYDQVVYETAMAKAKSFGYTCGSSVPTDDSKEAQLAAMDKAVEMGAKYVVTAGHMFTEIVQEVQEKYPNIIFLGVDSTTDDPDVLADNVTFISFNEVQAGFAAGYAVVMDGYTKLAFVGGKDVTSVENYGYGYIQGADYAAAELDKKDVTIDYWYSGTFDKSDEVRDRSEALYASGDEIIFSCGGAIIFSGIEAADNADGKLIGADSDLSGLSPRVVTSAYKNLKAATNAALSALFTHGGVWPPEYAGREVKMDASSNCVGLPTTEEAWRFESFTQEKFEAVMLKVIEGGVSLTDASSGMPETEYVTVNYID